MFKSRLIFLPAMLLGLILFGAGCAKSAPEEQAPQEQTPAAGSRRTGSASGICPITVDLVKRFCNISGEFILETDPEYGGCNLYRPNPRGNEFVFQASEQKRTILQEEFGTDSLARFVQLNTDEFMREYPAACFRPTEFSIARLGDEAVVGQQAPLGPSAECPECVCVRSPARSVRELETTGHDLHVVYRDRYLALRAGYEYPEVGGCNLTETQALARHIMGEETSEPQSAQAPAPAPSAAPSPAPQPVSQSQRPPEVAIAPNCDAIPDKLDTCSPFKCRFEHPLTGETLTQEILGIVSGKCSYTQQMPGGGRMTCNYSESMRRAVAQYNRDTAQAESVGTRLEIDPSGESRTTYTIDGREVENPSQEALSTGTCVIGGYGL